VRRCIWVAPATGVEFPGAAQVFRIHRDTEWIAADRPESTPSSQPLPAQTDFDFSWDLRVHSRCAGTESDWDYGGSP
jgi:hypothetical protein